MAEAGHPARGCVCFSSVSCSSGSQVLFLGYGSSVLEGQRRIGKVVVREAFHDGLSAHPVGKCVRLGCDSSSLAPNNNSSMLLLAHNLVKSLYQSAHEAVLLRRKYPVMKESACAAPRR